MSNMTRNLLRHGRIRTTVVKAKQTQRAMDRLITLGKEGSLHARRQAYQVLRDRDLVKQLFAEVAPRFLDCQGGYTRVLKLMPRIGDGAPQALLELTRLPVVVPTSPAKKVKPQPSVAPGTPASKEEPSEQAQKKPKRFLEGLRDWFRPKQGGAGS